MAKKLTRRQELVVVAKNPTQRGEVLFEKNIPTKPGQPGNAGRKAGSPNRVTTVLKDAIILAAEAVGEDNRGKDGLTGYLKRLAKLEPKAFAGLLGRVLPYHITGHMVHQHYETKEQVQDELRERGLPIEAIFGDDDIGVVIAPSTRTEQ